MAPSLTDFAAPPVLKGLAEADAATRLHRDGPNELPAARPRTSIAIALDVVREPMFLLLIAAGTVYLLLGDPEEASALLAAVFLIIGITLYQESKTERALDALRDLSSPRALVIRDGTRRRIAARDVVCGDLVVLCEGDRVPADAVVESSSSLRVDESLLTGESVPVHKHAHSAGRASTGAAADEGLTGVYSGTLVVRGEGIARVCAVGSATEMGKIGAALSLVETGRTILQREVDRAVGVLAAAGLGACALVGVVYGLSRNRWLDGALAGLTLAISMVPEEFPVILTVFLALGAWRISRSRVLTRRIPAVEALGSATVLCVDKTGTLTLNRMTVAALVAGEVRHSMSEPAATLPPPFFRLVETAVLASRPDAVDPMERAIVDCARSIGVELPDPSMIVAEYPLSDHLLAVTHVWRAENAATFEVTTKGAPETIAGLCRLSGQERIRLRDQVDAIARDGLRVIGVARAAWPAAAEPLPGAVADFPFVLVGLIGFADPVRPGVPAAIQECRAARIRVVMMTGDHATTALNIGRQIGLARTASCLTGRELAAMTDDELRRRVTDVDVFARITPDQKLRLVTALKANGEIVAMTGDGVNDAPALKAAAIGIAMGGRGTDVAREAASLVLLDDDFSSIVRAVRLGRRIYSNIEKATAYVLAIHVPIAGIALLPIVMGWPLILMPVHVIFMELIIDPASSIAFEMEPEEYDLMRRPPRNPRQRLFTVRMMTRSILQGVGACVVSAAVLAASVRAGMTELDVRTLTFATLILANLALIVTNRSLTRPFWATWDSSNPAVTWISVAAVAVLAAIVYVPWLRDLFRLTTIHADDAVVIVAATAAAFVWMESIKRLSRVRG